MKSKPPQIFIESDTGHIIPMEITQDDNPITNSSPIYVYIVFEYTTYLLKNFKEHTVYGQILIDAESTSNMDVYWKYMPGHIAVFSSYEDALGQIKYLKWYNKKEQIDDNYYCQRADIYKYEVNSDSVMILCDLMLVQGRWDYLIYEDYKPEPLGDGEYIPIYGLARAAIDIDKYSELIHTESLV